MREKHYWRAASLIPLLLPLISYFSVRFFSRITGTPSPPASLAQLFLLGSFFFGGLSYLLFIIITQAIIWSKPVKWDRRAALISPPMFLIVFLLGFQVYWLVTSNGSWFDSPRAFFGYSMLVLVIGYLYVGAAWAIKAILQRLGLIKQVEELV